MAKPTIYKTIDINSIHSRPLTALSSTESAKSRTILENFFTYFVAKHL